MDLDQYQYQYRHHHHKLPINGASRDSHDLSFLEASRNSVVDHMLLSFEAMPNTSSAPAQAIYANYKHSNAHSSPTVTRETHSAAPSSDFDLDPPFARHHRRHSSDDDPFAWRETHAASVNRPQTDDDATSLSGTVRAHVRGYNGMGSKASDENRLQHGSLVSQSLPVGRLPNSDFDPACMPDQRANGVSVMGRGRPVPGGYWHTDSAPEPFVPVGPTKRQASMSSMRQSERPMHPPVPPYDATDRPVKVPKRKNSVASARWNRRGRPDNSDTNRSQSENLGTNFSATRLGDATDPLAAPSPSAGYRKNVVSIASSSQTALSTPKEKEKTGFFRRVFGGSKEPKQTQRQPSPQPSRPPSVHESFQSNTHPPTHARQHNSAPSHPLDPANDRHERPKTQQGPAHSSHIAAQMIPSARNAPLPNVPPLPVEHYHEQQEKTLNKKPSSFFRRRRNKSTSERDPSRPPVTFLLQHPKLSGQQQQQPLGQDVAGFTSVPSSQSISSLRQVMNPYLSDAAPSHTSPGQRFSDNQETQAVDAAGEHDAELGPQERHGRGFSPGYTPHKDATIRSIANEDPVSADAPASPKFRVKLRKQRPRNRAATQGDSSLADSNGNVERNSANPNSSTAVFAGVHGGEGERNRPKTSPTQPEFVQIEGVGKENTLPPQHSPLPVPGSFPQSSPPTASDAQMQTTTPSKEHCGPWMNEATKMSSPITDYSHDSRSPSPPLGRVEDHDDGRLGRTREAMCAELRLKTHPSKTSNRIWIADDSDAASPSRDVSPMPYPIEGRGEKSRERDAPPVSPREIASLASTEDVFHSATSLPIVRVEGKEPARKPDHTRHKSQDSVGTDPATKAFAAESVAIDTETPQAEDRERAAQIFEGDESDIRKDRAAGWLGETSFISARTRKAFMELFDWTGLSILNAFRELCGRLMVRAESQQLDRIIDAFSKRWCMCNARHGFKAVDVVHTIAFSLLMLNTDLHLADMDSKMTRNEFIRNTLPTLRRIAEASAQAQAQVDAKLNPGTADGTSPTLATSPDRPSLVHTPSEAVQQAPSAEAARSKNNRFSLLGLDLAVSAAASGSSTPDNCTVLVNKPHEGTMKSWDTQVEIVLREFYNSIRQIPLPLHGSTQQDGSKQSLTVGSGSGLRRTPSVLSKAPSESMSHRGRAAELRSQTSRWPTMGGSGSGNKARSRPRIYTSSMIGSSRTSLDEQSYWSPAASSTWSKYSLGRNGTNPSSWNTGRGSISVESFGSGFTGLDAGYNQSIGFANALSQAIIREEHAALGSITGSDEEEFGAVRPLLEDETLELHGAPWAKEGLVKHKHHLDAIDKKAKDRAWSECFAVVEKGYLRLFSFNQASSKSLRQKVNGGASGARSGGGGGAGQVVGGGNWHSQAESLGCFLLRQTIASVLPPPGYSKQRPHVWALSLPTGAVHLFQVGTEDIGGEFVKSVNYWSARLSKEPLVGGVSNVEYGWGEGVIKTVSVAAGKDGVQASNSASAVQLPRTSMQGSVKDGVRDCSVDGTLHAGTPSTERGTVRAPRLAGDKASIALWTPPVQSMMASQLMEVDQLEALAAYVRAVEEDLDRHNKLRGAMSSAFSPRHPNGQRAQANWERKSAYLLREIVKFKTYVGSLTEAQELKDGVYREREEREREKDNRAAREGQGAGEEEEEGEDLTPEMADAVRRAESETWEP